MLKTIYYSFLAVFETMFFLWLFAFHGLIVGILAFIGAHTVLYGIVVLAIRLFEKINKRKNERL